jgi:predicted aspartyl protease
MNRHYIYYLISFLLLFSGWSTATAQYRAVVPFQSQNGKLIVSATVNNVQGRFLIDTGAPCCLTYSFAEKVGARPLSTQQAEDSNGNVVETKVVEMGSLSIGGVRFMNLQAMRWGKGNIAENYGIDGIIGYNLLKRGIVKLDALKKEFTFTDYDKDLGIDYTYSHPLLKDKFLTLFTINIGRNSNDTIMFDSGAAGFYEMSKASYERLKTSKKDVKLLCSGEGVLSAGVGGIEKPSMKYRLKLPLLTIGKARFANVVTVTTDATNSRIGSALLNHGSLVIDYKNDILYFLPTNKDDVPDLYEKDWDVAITVENGYLSAGLVWNTLKSTLRRGDRIVSIDGERYDEKIDMVKATTTGILHLKGDEAVLGYLDKNGKECQVKMRKR